MHIRAVVDTNVLISATFWHGNSEIIIQKAENQEFTLILSMPILEEYSKVLHSKEITEKIRDKNLEIRHSIQKISSLAEMINIKTKLNIVKDDPDDDKILECAVDGKAKYLITQDKHLLKIKQFQNIKIVTPAEFLILLQK